MLIVQKYGGMSLATTERIKSVADRVAKLRRTGAPVLLVVSAMGKTTDELTRLAYQVSRKPHRRELDMLLTTGERVAMSLMSMALNDLGCPAISFTGSQAGVMTQGPHSDASIEIVKPFRVEESLRAGRVVVLAGYQGVDPQTKEITTLGRGGTDTTAVAFAAHFKAADCQIMKEVDGLFTVDPRWSSQARLINKIDFDSMVEMCDAGAKVLHRKSVELARRLGTPISIGRADTQAIGTRVVTRANCDTVAPGSALGVNVIDRIEHIAIEAKDVSAGVGRLRVLCDSEMLPMPRIWASAWEKGMARFMISSHWEILDSVLRICRETPGCVDLQKTLAGLSVTYMDQAPSRAVSDVMEALSRATPAVEKVLTSTRTITAFIPPKEIGPSVETLHRLTL